MSQVRMRTRAASTWVMSLLHFKEHRKDFDLAFRVEVCEGSHSVHLHSVIFMFVPHCLFRLDSSE